MNSETLQVIWFILIAVLWIGFFFLEGFDFGVGMLLPFLGKRDEERRVIINTIGPHWDGNEVWLLTAGGATFAAFPHWYATLFSGFYPALFLLLIGLILRGVAFEFRSKDANPTWRKLWDCIISVGSFLPALLFGVAFANLARGVPIDSTMTYTGNLFTLLNPYGLLGGLFTVTAFLLHGAIYINMKVEGAISDRAADFAQKVWVIVIVLSVLTLVGSFFYTDLGNQLIAIIISLIGIFASVSTGLFLLRRKIGWAFAMTGLVVMSIVATTFLIMFPNVMISTIDPAFSLTISNASSSHYTLTVMTIVALIFTPIVIAYQAWTFWVFRKRVLADPEKLIY